MALEPIDFVALALVALAMLRGLFRGLLRESFSIAAVAAAVFAVKLFYAPVAEWLIQTTDGGVGPTAAPWAAGALLTVATVGTVALIGRVARRGARTVGLGWADRLGGAALGTAEGVLVASILIGLIGYVVGREHPVLVESRSLHAFEDLERFAESGDLGELPEITLPSVASGPDARERREASE